MFHWICPECGREIPPTVKECQVCDPAAAKPAVEPVASAPPALPIEARNEPTPEPVLATPVPQNEATPEPVRLDVVFKNEARPEPADVPDLPAPPVLQNEARPEPTPEVVKVDAVQNEAAPAVAIETKPEAAAAPDLPAQPVPQNEATPAAAIETQTVLQNEAKPEPTPEPVKLDVVQNEARPTLAPAPVADPEPIVPAETKPEPIAEPAVELAAPLAVEPAPIVAEPTAEPVAEPVAASDDTLAATAEFPAAAITPQPEPPSIAQPPEPVAIAAPPILDPLLVLAEEIRAAQAARAAGLLELAEAVGLRESEPEPAPAAAPSTLTADLTPAASAPSRDHQGADNTAHAPVALLAPPEQQIAVPEPAGIQDLRPVALAPVPQPAAEPESSALAEPQAQPAALAPEPVRIGPTLPLAPMQDYTPATSSSIQPVRPPMQILSADAGPRITLPGPTLPPQLARLQDANVVTIIGEDTAQRKTVAIDSTTKRSGAPGWLVSGLVMLLLLTAGLAFVFYLFPHTVADAKPAPTPAVAATSPAPTTGNSPLSKFVEVTGFRIVTSSADATKKSEVQYLIVNHSDADISDANVFVTLRSAKPGQAPLCRFSFKVPSLGPYESKEMSSPIEKSPRALSLPDWQDLRAEVQISQ